MSLLFAWLKLFARNCNDFQLQHDLNKAKEINGTEIYQKNLKKNIHTAKSRHSNRDKFISDL